MDADALYAQAMQEIDADRHEEAQRLLARVLQVNPRHEQAWLALALIVPEMDRAIECLSRVLTLNPHNAEAIQYLELAHEEQRRDDEAESLLEDLGQIERAAGDDEPPAPSPAHGSHEATHLPRLGRYLLEAGVVSVTQLEAALAAQRKAASAGKPRRLGEILVQQGAITLKELDTAVREQFQRFNSLFWD